MGDSNRYRCERCNELLKPGKEVFLELSTKTGLYSDPNTNPLPDTESQGGFTFGPACAKAVLKAGGVNEKRLRR